MCTCGLSSHTHTKKELLYKHFCMLVNVLISFFYSSCKFWFLYALYFVCACVLFVCVCVSVCVCVCTHVLMCENVHICRSLGGCVGSKLQRDNMLLWCWGMLYKTIQKRNQFSSIMMFVVFEASKSKGEIFIKYLLKLTSGILGLHTW